jgi:tetraacyldisaccharide 4'-kinase
MPMASGHVKIYPALLPLSWIYSLVTRGRNQLFDWGLLPQEQFQVPVIAVGNLTVGGTGKTPHVEHLVRLLKDQFPVAVLSRGYRRETKGFLIADANSTAADIGDEPLQMHQKFPTVTVAVDADRRNGIRMLLARDKAPGVILLDDAYQHRYVKAGLTLLLTDYHRLFSRDLVLPAGRLREPRKGKRRADIVVVTKCPPTLSEEECRAIALELALDRHQRLYFSSIDYAALQPLEGGHPMPLDELAHRHVLLLTGIANPGPVEATLRQHAGEVSTLRFADHHTFTSADMERVSQAFNFLADPKLLLTTEKDAARLDGTGLLPATLRTSGYTLPIRIRILHQKEEQFNQQIIDYVRKNIRDGILA